MSFMGDTSGWGLLLVAGGALVARLVAGRLDRERIREYIESAGGRVLNIVWNPTGPGWLGSSERIYDVTYETRGGEVLTATCKTTLTSGVYWTGQAAPSGLIENSPTKPVSGEAIHCAKCGSKLESQQLYCPSCGSHR